MYNALIASIVFKYLHIDTYYKQAISALERALCQLPLCFEHQSKGESKRRTQNLSAANSIQK